MKIHSFITTFSRKENSLSVDEPGVVRQAFTVLKLAPGEVVYVGDGKHIRYLAKISSIDKKLLNLEILGEEQGQTNTPEIIIALATVKRESFEYALEKLTEVGVDGILPLSTDRTIKKGINVERSKTILREASEQSGRIISPILFEEAELGKTLEYFSSKDGVQLVFCDTPNSELPSKAEAPKRIIKNPNSIVFFVGPEGGWSDRERLSAQLLGIPNYTVGKTILRAETAAIVIAFMAVNNKL